MAEIKLSKSNFEQEVLTSSTPVLVDFWAPWCGPCQMIGPIVSEIAQDYEGRVKVGKVNVDDEGDLAVEFGVVSIPTLIVFNNGEVVAKSVGYCSKEDIENLINLG